MHQIQTEVEQTVHDYIRDAPEFPKASEIILHLKGHVSAETVKVTLTELLRKKIILLHDDGACTLNNPDFKFKESEWMLL